jgi:hypothetical protein
MSNPTYCYGNEASSIRGRVKYYETRSDVIDYPDHHSYHVQGDRYIISNLAINAVYDPDEDIPFYILNMQCHFEVLRSDSESALNGSLSLQLAGLDRTGRVLWTGNINYSGETEPDYIWQSILTSRSNIQNTHKLSIAYMVYISTED